MQSQMTLTLIMIGISLSSCWTPPTAASKLEEDAAYDSGNASLVAALNSYFNLDGKEAVEVKGGVSLQESSAATGASGAEGCQLKITKLSEPGNTDAAGIQISLATTGVADTEPSTVEFEVWKFKPSQRSWSRNRTVGALLRGKGPTIEFAGMGLNAQIVSHNFDQTILLTQREVNQSISLRRFESGGLEVTVRNIDAGVLPTLLAKPKTASCRFDNTSA